MKQRNKVDRNAPITSKHVFFKRSAKMIDGTEKPKIPSRFAKRAARYSEFGYKKQYITAIENIRFEIYRMFLFSRRLFAEHHTLRS